MEENVQQRETLGGWIVLGLGWLLMEGLPTLAGLALTLFVLFLLYRGLLTIL